MPTECCHSFSCFLGVNVLKLKTRGICFVFYIDIYSLVHTKEYTYIHRSIETPFPCLYNCTVWVLGSYTDRQLLQCAAYRAVKQTGKIDDDGGCFPFSKDISSLVYTLPKVWSNGRHLTTLR